MFVKTLDYGDIIHDQAFNNSFHQKIESLQYSMALAITGAIRGTSRGKIYQKLGVISTKTHKNAHHIPHINVKHQFFKNSYFHQP